MPRILAFAFLAAAIAALPACKSSGTAPNPPTGAGSRASYIVVGDIGNDALVTFPATATGTVAPTYDVVGAGTGVDEPYNIFVDKAAGTLWASNWHDGSDGTLTEYSLTATGDTAPTVTIGPAGSTTLEGPTGVYVTSSGEIIVADYDAYTIDFFAAGSSGSSAAPTKQITGLFYPEGIWLDSDGNIWVSNAGTAEILEFSSSASGAATPLTAITGVSAPEGVYIDSHGNIWVGRCTGSVSTASIDEFAPGSNGAATPTREIVGSNTNQDCPYAIAVDGAGYVYEADLDDGVNVFSPSADGNVAPIQTIPLNATTGLKEPSGIAIY